MHTRSADWRAADDCIGGCSEARSIQELLPILCAKLRRVLNADIVIMTTYAADWSVTGYRISPELDVAHLFPAFLHYFPEHPWYGKLDTIAVLGRTPTISDSISLRNLMRTGLWNEVYAHLYSKHQLSAGGRLADGGFYTFSINRLGRDYGPRDRELIRYMRPQLEVLILRATRAEHAQRLAETLQQFFVQGDNAYVWIAPDGAVREMSPAAQRLLGSASRKSAGVAALPREITAALRRLQPQNGGARRFVSVPTPQAEFLLVSLGADAGTLVLVEPPNAVERSPRPALTRREAEVLRWLGEGKSNAEIGVLCGISPRTVGRHCENLFAKLGVESRYAAAIFAREGRV